MKNKIILTFILIIIILSLPSILLAQPAETEKISSYNQIQALEKQINLMDQINNKILNTIYWALGGLITVFLAIIGLNFFQNFSLNKRKLDTFKEESKTELKQALSELQEQNNKNVASLNTKIETLIKTKIETTLGEFKNDIKELDDNLKEIERQNLIRAAFEYKTKGALGYILNLIRVLELDIKRGWDWRIAKSLELISTCLDDAYTDAESLASLQKILDQLPANYAIHKKQIEEKMHL